MVSLKSRSIEAGEAVARSRDAEKWLRGRGAGHVLFKICSTFDSTDAGNIGPVMDALRADCGEKIVLVTPAFPETGRTVYQGNLFVGLGAAERKPAEGSSAQPDARFQSGAGAGAAEQDQSRVGRTRDARPRAPTRSARGSPSLRARALVPPSSMPCSTATSKPSARSRLDHRLSVGASGIGLGLARALVSIRQGASRPASNAASGAAIGGPAACLAGSCSQATLAADRQRGSGHAGAASRSRSAWSPARRKRAARWPGRRSGSARGRS